jgi:hypothetical protein
MEIQYTVDKENNEIITDDRKQHQVMMEWEKPYMEHCIDILDPSGSVLEIGFGFGYSARKICMNKNVTQYTVIECSPVVWGKFEEFKKIINTIRPELAMTLVKGRWQDVLSQCMKYDSIFFDDYDYDNNVSRFSYFLESILKNHSILGTKISCYSTVDVSDKLNKVDFISCKTHKYNIQIPEYCNYAKGDTMYIPIITKHGEYNETFDNQILNKNNTETNMNVQRERINKIESYVNSKKSTEVNYLIIENFYNNPNETREFILKQPFTYNNTMNCEVSKSFLNDECKIMMSDYIKSSILQNVQNKNVVCVNHPLNGCYLRLKSDSSWEIMNFAINQEFIKYNYQIENIWVGVLFMSPYGPLSSGLGIYSFQDGTRTTVESEIRENKNVLQAYSHDTTKWVLLDKYCGIFNRLILFKANAFASFVNNFGISNEDSNLVQFFMYETM